MKNNKKSVFLKRLTLFLAVCLAVIPSLALLSSAEAASFFKKWTMSDDMSTIYGDGVPYHKIEDRGFSASNHTGYVFYNEIEDEYGHGTYSVTSTDENGSYVWLSSYEIYATEEGRQSFDELKSLSGASGYKMYDSNNYYAEYCQNNNAELCQYYSGAYNGQNDKNGHCNNSVHGKACEARGSNTSRLIVK